MALSKERFFVYNKMMRIYVSSLLVLTAFFSAPSSAETPRKWEQYSKVIECDPNAANQDDAFRTRCLAASRAFCDMPSGNTCNEIPAPQSASTKQELQRRVTEALAQCQAVANPAKSSCMDFATQKTIPPDAVNGTQELCKKFQGEAERNAMINTSVGGHCQGLQGRCNVACAGALEAIRQAAAACADCAPVLTSAEFQKIQQLQTNVCTAIKPTDAVQQAEKSSAAAKTAQFCKNSTGAQPGEKNPSTEKPGSGKPSESGSKSSTAKKDSSGNSLMNPSTMMGLAQMAMAMAQMGNQDDQQQMQPNSMPTTDSVDCSVNANLAGCEKKADSWNTQSAAGADAAGATSGNAGGFNLPDEGGSAMDPASTEPKAAGTPPTVGGVPSNGGGMTGGGGGSSASLGSGGGGGGASAPSSPTVQLGTSSGGGGGFSAMNNSMNLKNGDSGGGYTYGGAGSRGEAPLDLSQFLPGGRQDPTRKLAGVEMNARNFQIQGSGVNIWSRISSRIQSRCSQGLLRDCVP